VLVKTRQTRSQKKLDARERKKNLLAAFETRQSVSGMRILLIDDVFTTGSTVEAAAQCLLQAGASEVFFLTLCVAISEEPGL
jgi:ComF family protein